MGHFLRDLDFGNVYMAGRSCSVFLSLYIYRVQRERFYIRCRGNGFISGAGGMVLYQVEGEWFYIRSRGIWEVVVPVLLVLHTDLLVKMLAKVVLPFGRTGDYWLCLSYDHCALNIRFHGNITSGILIKL